MCLYPKLIDNPKYKPNKKNNGIPPTCKDERLRKVAIGCGKCMECMKQKKRNWQVRLLEEVSRDRTGQFVTLSFSEEEIQKLISDVNSINPNLKGYELENEAATLAIRRFTELWRQYNGTQPKRWLITELGHRGTERIHIHGLIFTKTPKEIINRWLYGNVYIGDRVNGQTVNYIIKYVTKTDIDHPNYKPKILTSKGIGKEYTDGPWRKNNRYNGTNTKEYYQTEQGYKIALPIYYRNKLYTEDERENLWLHKLDKQERWINGIRVDTSKNLNEYFNLLDQARALNKQLGYGNDKVNWEQRKYEQDLRILRNNLRIKKLNETSIPNEKRKRNNKKNLRILQKREIDNNMDNNNSHLIKPNWNRLQNYGEKFESDKDNRIQESQIIPKENLQRNEHVSLWTDI